MSSIAANTAALLGNATSDGFNCVGVHDLPFMGNEILAITIIYLSLICVYCVTFIDVAIKQTWPATFLDSEVFKRVKQLQADFPGIMPGGGGSGKVKVVASEAEAEAAKESDPLGLDDESQWDPVVKVTKPDGQVSTVRYDTIVSQEPYIASCCVDEDLTFILANNTAFGTVSSYCSSTVRGYAMLSTILPIVGTTLGFLWIHNAMVDPIKDNYARYTGIIGYFLCFLTGVVMIGPNSTSVHRNRNILLWDSVQTNSKVLDLHSIGIVGFCLVPLLGNLYQVVFQPVTGHELPNRDMMWKGFIGQLLGLLAFEGPSLLKKCNLLSDLQAKQIGIIGELTVLIASMLTFLQIETFAAATCTGSVTTYDAAIVGTLFGIFTTLCVKHYAGAPVGPYTNDPSVLLMHYGTPVASSGPVPVLNYNREAAILPIIQPAGSQ